MTEQRKQGDLHVAQVAQALRFYIDYGYQMNSMPKTVLETARFLQQRFPNLQSIQCKFDYKNTDERNDLILILNDNSQIPVNLFRIKGNSTIQQKNLGAQSFLSKYFQSDKLQEKFNLILENELLLFLRKTADLVVEGCDLNNSSELRKLIREYMPTFKKGSISNFYREEFLFHLRENSYSLLQNNYNTNLNGFAHAYQTLLMPEDLNVVTRYFPSDEVRVEVFTPSALSLEQLKIYKKGANTIGIQYGSVALLLRFKFESGPASSIKLATSYEFLSEIDSFEQNRQGINRKTIQEVEKILGKIEYVQKDNTSNAIGKVNEAFVYIQFLNQFSNIIQVDEKSCQKMLEDYAKYIRPEILQKLKKVSKITVGKITDYLKNKHGQFILESIQLVPESYLKNRRDTSDLQLSLRINNKYLTESLSLKAIDKLTTAITTKNPGYGSILGATYFDIGDLSSYVDHIKEMYLRHKLDRRECQEALSKKLGLALLSAPISNIRQGVKSLLGEAVVVVTAYGENRCICKEHGQITGDIQVLTQTPSPIQTTITWNNCEDQITLRVKFSRGQQHGWSTIKLTSEYQITT